MSCGPRSGRPVIDREADIPAVTDEVQLLFMNDALRIERCTIPAGSLLPMHGAPAPVAITALSGRGSIRLADGASASYRDGDTTSLPGAPHERVEVATTTVFAVSVMTAGRAVGADWLRLGGPGRDTGRTGPSCARSAAAK